MVLRSRRRSFCWVRRRPVLRGRYVLLGPAPHRVWPALTSSYRRRAPERTVLYELVAQHALFTFFLGIESVTALESNALQCGGRAHERA